MPQVHTALGSGVLRFGRDFIKNRQPLLSLHESRTEEGVTKDLKPIMSELNKEMVDLVWGKPSGGGISTSIFRRWSQGRAFVVITTVSACFQLFRNWQTFDILLEEYIFLPG